MKKIWPFSFYFLYFAALSSFMPFIVLFYQALQFNGTQIGLLTGIPPLITLVAAPFWTGVADASRRHRLIMSLGIAMAVALVLLLQTLNGFVLIFITIVIFNFFFSPVASLSDSATIAMLGEDRGMYGRIRLGGTIGWGVVAPIAGALVENYGLKLAFWGFSALMFVNFFIVQKMVHDVTEQGSSNHGGVRYFLTSRRWILFLLLAFLGGLGSFSAASYLFPYMAEMGASETIMGLALTLSTMTELPIFFFGNRLVKRFGSQGLLMLSLILIGLRSLLYALVSAPFAVLIVQMLGGTVFPALWLAGVTYADEHAPPGLKSTAQGLFGAMTFGFGSAVAGFVGGPLLESIGGRGMFLVFGLFILGGIGLIELVKRLLPVEEVPQAVL
ncbi:MAG TPA: major facilitator superfamily domain-containing protein 6 [Anaerolineales bacterium]|nr:major facilitator superfamily domain-containing protein 6 [Anaerolineales bacterium]